MSVEGVYGRRETRLCGNVVWGVPLGWMETFAEGTLLFGFIKCQPRVFNPINLFFFFFYYLVGEGGTPPLPLVNETSQGPSLEIGFGRGSPPSLTTSNLTNSHPFHFIHDFKKCALPNFYLVENELISTEERKKIKENGLNEWSDLNILHFILSLRQYSINIITIKIWVSKSLRQQRGLPY
jgi:hypothetical protein